ncbi:hypothetical protein B0H11DRAFT_2023484 [Mycena galericulata]|nr:hypothetical protein B0H11DRAFT_2023484 [Mycena galericulata]
MPPSATPPPHPALSLERLSELPLSVRRIAKDAVRGSAESLQMLEKPFKLAPKNVLQTFYHLPDDLYPLFWPRVWAWITFIDLYDTHFHCIASVRADDTHDHDSNRVLFLNVIANFKYNSQATELVDRTVGVWTMVAEMWVLGVQRNVFGLHSVGDMLSRLLLRCVSPAAFEEIVAALGGNESDLAVLVLKHIELAACDPQNPLTPHNIWNLQGILTFVFNARFQWSLSFTAFPERRLVKALVTSVCSLARILDLESSRLMARSMRLLHLICSDRPLNVSMPIALQSGILRAIVACATYGAGPIEEDYSLDIVTGYLSPSLVYYHVLRRISRALEEVSSAKMTATPMNAHWTAFVELAKSRLILFESFNAAEFASCRVCDNPTCDMIDRVERVKACSSCKQRVYCCEACQRVDWDGTHRLACNILSGRYIDHPENLGNRELAFLRALVHHDYVERKYEIQQHRDLFMLASPTLKFHLRFDYSNSASGISVIPHGAPDDNPEASEPSLKIQSANKPTYNEFHEFDGYFRLGQTAVSDGRIEVHEIVIASWGENKQMRWIPMRSGTSALVDGLRRMADGIGPSSDPRDPQINARILAGVKDLDEEIGKSLR